MNTRRDFVRGLTGIGAIVATGHAPAIVKSMIAARGTMLGGAHAWTNPYVTDGLVAMWDGVWNAGPGVHDPNATTWVDLIDGRILTFTEGITIDSDAIGFSLKESAYSSNNIGLTTSNVIHGEICIDIPSPNTNNQYAQFASSNSRVFANAYDFRGGISLANAVAGHGAWPSGKHTMSAHWPSNTLHIDSIQRDAVSTMDGWGVRSKNTIIGDVIRDGQNRGFNGRLHSIRIYNRQLTAAEIAANYAVDKARFNLP